MMIVLLSESVHLSAVESGLDAMAISNEYERLLSSTAALPVVLELLADQTQFTDRAEFLAAGLSKIADALQARYVATARAIEGRWQVEPSPAGTLPTDLLADVLDADRPAMRENWFAAAWVTRDPRGEILLAQIPTGGSLETVDACAACLGLAVRQVEARQAAARRTRRLEAILEIAAQWNQNLELEPLLNQMAETSTRLLKAERASIFLWDRVKRQLVGRPALGVEDGELRIPDNAGIVGQVVNTGQVCRVDEDQSSELIDRSVDQQLGFETRTLLCVPLRGRGGEVLGAFEMINKIDANFSDEDADGLVELASHASIALENCQNHEQLLRSRQQIAQQAAAGVRMIGETPVVRELRTAVERVAATDLAILVLGENGTGKEVISQMIHYLSDRRDEPFIAVNCAALAETLLESELFGHEKGAFTDAHEARAGKFEAASGGTLFLDEIGDLSLAGQAKLLRVLEEKVVVRVGGSLPIRTDARVIAATNQNLAQMVRERTFREDLFFRLNVVTLEVPPLRDRVDDIMLLAEHFLRTFAAQARRETPCLTPAAEKRLRQHPWPGNVRELRNLMERLAYLSPGDTIDAGELAFIIAPGKDEMPAISMDLSLTDATRQFQVDYIHKHIEAAGRNMSDAARKLGLHRSNLYRKMRQLGMATKDDEESFED